MIKDCNLLNNLVDTDEFMISKQNLDEIIK